MTTVTHSRSGRVWLIAIVAVAALAAGGVGTSALRHLRDKGPTTQAVLDFLYQPLPTPEGAKDKEAVHRYCSPSGGSGAVTWGSTLALDVTDMKPDEIEAIPSFYVSHFKRMFPRLAETAGFTKNGYNVFTGNDGWRQVVNYRDGNVVLSIDAEVMDYEMYDPETHTHASVKRNILPVGNFNEPVNGRRMMLLRLHFVGWDLSGPGTFPGSP